MELWLWLLAGLPLLLGFWSPNFDGEYSPAAQEAKLLEEKRRKRIEERREKERGLYLAGRPPLGNYIYADLERLERELTSEIESEERLAQWEVERYGEWLKRLVELKKKLPDILGLRTK